MTKNIPARKCGSANVAMRLPHDVKVIDGDHVTGRIQQAIILVLYGHVKRYVGAKATAIGEKWEPWQSVLAHTMGERNVIVNKRATW